MLFVAFYFRRNITKLSEFKETRGIIFFSSFSWLNFSRFIGCRKFFPACTKALRLGTRITLFVACGTISIYIARYISECSQYRSEVQIYIRGKKKSNSWEEHRDKIGLDIVFKKRKRTHFFLVSVFWKKGPMQCINQFGKKSSAEDKELD